MGDDNTIYWPKINPARLPVWSDRSELVASEVMSRKILSTFSSVTSLPLKRIVIQFWRPVKSPAGNMLLSCTGYPYALSHVNRLLLKYRSGCVKYFYSINGEVDDPMTISDAPPSHAIANLCTEVVLDLRVHRGTPLVDLALECELTCFFMTPVFDETQCVGVIEVSMRHPADLLVIFCELKEGLKTAGLRITPPPSLYTPLFYPVGFNVALREANNAFGGSLHSHPITLAQLWYSYESLIYSPQNTIVGSRRFFRRLASNAVGDPLDPVMRFYNDLCVLPFEKVSGLVGRTLRTGRPHLCRNIYNLSDNNGVLALLSANAMCSSFVICLRSHYSGALSYVFEFFWPQSSNHLALMEGLLLTLREYLPSFKHACGAELGGELLVVDVDNSSSGKIFPGNKISETPKAYDQHPLTSINNPEDYYDDDLVILAAYKVHCRLFFLPSSCTFENVIDKIKQEFEHELNPAGAYKVEYQVVPGKWYSLSDDTSLKSCISSYRASTNIDYIKFYVLTDEK